MRGMKQTRKPLTSRFPFWLALMLTGIAIPVLAQLMPNEVAAVDAAARATASAQFAQAISLPDEQPPRGETITSDVVVQGAWTFGFLVTRAPEGIHSEPELRLFIGQRNENSGWQIAVEGDPAFLNLLPSLPGGLMPEEGRTLLLQNQAQARGEASPRAVIFGLPYAQGQAWTLTGGPHTYGGSTSPGARPRSSLDMAYPPATSGKVRAAESGIVYRASNCPNYIRVDHADGFQTSYYHVVNERVNNGESVLRGDILADEGASFGCGGYATGPHVHFSLLRYGVYQDLAGYDFGGWEVEESANPYDGCMLRLSDSTRLCRGNQILYGEGSIPVANDPRYDFNADTRADLWAVDLRPDDGSGVRAAIYAGAGLTGILTTGQTSLPQQPVELNTWFGAGDYDGDEVPDLWLLHRRFDSSGVTALRIMSGANLQFLIEDTPTALPELSDDTRFALGDYDRDGKLDIYALTPDTVSNTVLLRVVNGAAWNTLLVTNTLPFEAPGRYADVNYAVADFDSDGRPDIWQIEPRSASGVRVTVLKGSGFSQILAQAVTPWLPTTTDINRIGWVVTDFNRDGTPDLWRVDRKNGFVAILSGIDFQSVLRDADTALPKTSNFDWQILGSDRARERIAPGQPRLDAPPPDAVLSDSSVRFEFRPGGLAKKQQLRVFDGISGLQIGSVKVGDNFYRWCADGITCAMDLAAMSIVPSDGLTITWDVVASSGFGQTVSPRRSLSFDLPGVPLLLSPLADSVVESPPLFQWEPRPTATRYKLVVRDSLGQKTKLVVQAEWCAPTLCSGVLPAGLPAGAARYWVLAYDALGGKSKSAKVSVMIAPALPLEPTP
jgi:murein DD-endopeptidase MepM/ murein hydrolase activator NlpD